MFAKIKNKKLNQPELKLLHLLSVRKSKKSKAVPLHAMEAHGGRGGTAPTHS
jgi:hypothetical protein